jgi:hypothetical protein
MGKPMGRHPHTRYIKPNPKTALKRGRDPAISASTWAPPSTNLSKSQKEVKHDQGSSKLGRGPTCPQHLPVTHPESL